MKIKTLYVQLTPIGATLSNVAAYDETGRLRSELTYSYFGELVDFLAMCQEKAENLVMGKPAPKIGEIFEFIYTDPTNGKQEPTRLLVTHVTDSHVYYKFLDGDGLGFAWSFPMVHDVWNANSDNRVKVGETTDPDALVFITHQGT